MSLPMSFDPSSPIPSRESTTKKVIPLTRRIPEQEQPFDFDEAIAPFVGIRNAILIELVGAVLAAGMFFGFVYLMQLIGVL